MRFPALPRSVVTIGFIAVIGAGCGQLDPWLDAVQRHKGGNTATPPGPAGTSGASTGAAGASGGAAACVKIPDGGPTSCKPYDIWKQYGTDACTQQKMQLTDLVGGTTCGAGYQDVTYVCCAAPPTGSTGSGTGGSSGGADMCTKIDEGGAGSCKPYDIWKQYGYDRCQQQNLLLTAITVGPACDGGYQSMTFTCCGNTGTPTPPPKCGQTSDATGQICKTCWDAVSGQVISNDCAPGPTGSGGSGGGAQMCIFIDDGGPTSCKDASTWKQYGSDRCGQQNLALMDLKLAIACDGGYSMVSYVCCGGSATPPPVVACDSWYRADGALCKQCRDANGAVNSLDCVGGQMPSNEICDVKSNPDGSQCKTCYYSDGTMVSSCTSP
jgi:hypothetical protein